MFISTYLRIVQLHSFQFDTSRKSECRFLEDRFASLIQSSLFVKQRLKRI